jgi:Fe-Mn family superoxide dismutase
MRLHELYFGNMTKEKTEASAELASAIEKEFGSFEMFTKDFNAMGAMRGIGWVVLYHDKTANRLFNVWINEHDVGHFAGATPLLVMDVFEHAFMLDYGLKRADYITAFWNSIDWSVVSDRLKS